MSDRIELCRQNLIDALKTIKLAAGYQNDVSAVEPAYFHGNIPADRKLVVQQADIDNADVGNTTHTFNDVAFDVVAYVGEDDEGEAQDARFNSLLADIVKAACKDESSFHRGGKAIGTWFEFSERDASPDVGMPFIVVRLRVQVRTLLDDLNS